MIVTGFTLISCAGLQAAEPQQVSLRLPAPAQNDQMKRIVLLMPLHCATSCAKAVKYLKISNPSLSQWHVGPLGALVNAGLLGLALNEARQRGAFNARACLIWASAWAFFVGSCRETKRG